MDALYEKHIKNAKSMFIYILLFLSVAFGIYLTEDTADINHTVRMVRSKLFTNNFPIELKNGISFEGRINLNQKFLQLKILINGFIIQQHKFFEIFGIM